MNTNAIKLVAPTIEVDRISSNEWSECLDRFWDANIYQTWAYGEVRWGDRRVSRLVMRNGSNAIALAQLRIAKLPGRLGGVAHLRWGPVIHRKGEALSPLVASLTAGALIDEYVLKRRLFLKIYPNACSGSPRGEIVSRCFDQFQRQSFAVGESHRTLLLDLSPRLETLRSRLKQKWRNQLNRAEKNQLEIVEGDSVELFRQFRGILEQMWKRKRLAIPPGARDFERIQASLPPHQRMRIFLCFYEGELAAGVVGTALGDMGRYLLGATNDRGMKSKAAYLLQWRMISWLQEAGIAHYDLGGTNPVTNPGVYHFKKGLGGEDVLYHEPLVACESLLSRSVAALASRIKRWKRG